MTHRELKSPTFMKQEEERDATYKSRVTLGIIYILLLLRIIGLCFFLWMEVYQSPQVYKNVNCPEGNCTYLPEVYTHSNLPVDTEKDCVIHYGKWSCCEKSCYYFSNEENKTWDDSRKSCRELGYNLSKIDDEAELRFIQSKIKHNHWVGLHKNEGDHPWQWQDGSRPSVQVNFQMTPSTSEVLCGHLNETNIVAEVCTKEFYYICEKTYICMYK